MNRKRTDIMERRQKLLELIRQARDGQINVDQTAALLGVSAVTLRRDLALLEEEGKVRRGYGRVSLVGVEPVGPIGALDAPNRIARIAATHVDTGDVIFVNTSRTALRMLRYIQAPNVTVITNNVLAANVPHRGDMTVILTGGEVRFPKYAMVGSVAQQSLCSIQAQKAFLGCSGLSVERGITTEHFGEVAVNNLMLASVSGPVYLLADHSKLGRDSHFASGELRQVHSLITDRAADPQNLQSLREAGLEIELA